MVEDGRGGGETITEQDDVQLTASEALERGWGQQYVIKEEGGVGGGGGGGQRQEGGGGSQNIK